MTTRRSHLHPATGVALTAAFGAASGWTNTVTHLLDVAFVLVRQAARTKGRRVRTEPIVRVLVVKPRKTS